MTPSEQATGFCDRCDRPLATDELSDHADGCECDECKGACWREFGGDCTPKDWKEEYWSVFREYQIESDENLRDVCARLLDAAKRVADLRVLDRAEAKLFLAQRNKMAEVATTLLNVLVPACQVCGEPATNRLFSQFGCERHRVGSDLPEAETIRWATKEVNEL